MSRFFVYYDVSPTKLLVNNYISVLYIYFLRGIRVQDLPVIRYMVSATMVSATALPSDGDFVAYLWKSSTVCFNSFYRLSNSNSRTSLDSIIMSSESPRPWDTPLIPQRHALLYVHVFVASYTEKQLSSNWTHAVKTVNITWRNWVNTSLSSSLPGWPHGICKTQVCTVKDITKYLPT
jgi:hypothetical protein